MMNRAITRMLIITQVTEMIANKLKITIGEARDLFYASDVCNLLEDDSTGLYGEAPQRTFDLFIKEYKNKK